MIRSGREVSRGADKRRGAKDELVSAQTTGINSWKSWRYHQESDFLGLSRTHTHDVGNTEHSIQPRFIFTWLLVKCHWVPEELCLAINGKSSWLLCECFLRLDSRWPMPRLLGIILKSLQPGCLRSLTLSQVSTCAVLACWPMIISDRRLVRNVPLRAGGMTAGWVLDGMDTKKKNSNL